MHFHACDVEEIGPDKSSNVATLKMFASIPELKPLTKGVKHVLDLVTDRRMSGFMDKLRDNIIGCFCITLPRLKIEKSHVAYYVVVVKNCFSK